jgi:NAD(P)H-quinone oxidoreductase subunit 5
MNGTFATPAPGPLEWALIVLTLLSLVLSLWRRRCCRSGLSSCGGGHACALSNGFYANAVFDELLRSPTTSIPHSIRGDSKGAEEPVGFLNTFVQKN